MSAPDTSSSHIQIDTLAWLIEDAYQGDSAQSLLANLHDVREEEWTALLPRAGRSILEKDRLTNWGERLPTRVIIRMMIAHNFYHAGEINHLRAVLNDTDKWPYE